MASSLATTSPRYFYQPPLADKSNERKESFSSSVSNKSIENPLLGRDPPPLQTETAPPQHNAPPFSFGAASSANDSSAGTSVFESDGVMGLRHRRRQPGLLPTGADNKENRSLALMRGGGGGGGGGGVGVRHASPSLASGLPPPPRASYSLGTGMDHVSTNLDQHYHASRGVQSTPMAGASSRATPHTPSVVTENSLVPSTSNCWVLVFGYATNEQYEELLQRFSSFGQVLDHRGLCQPGQSNWIAIQYANELEAKKALCHSTVKLSSNIYCCVQPLADDDPILLHKYPSTLAGSNGLWSTGTTTDVSSAALGGLTENDILLKGRIQTQREENICTRMLRWVLGVPAYDDGEEEESS
eukprot:CAMPEP_0168728068 /NCGR_PEP_ID=MMETSP0724-20121128/5495_1 /TAXON_ID=265536 /ORGANISM="Amphiprora sp., Strain CCMP467" /LENGTH=356 /DNA_ID=CAMNT_0008774905 /DNA_START=43 /DNA_END=1113 /DNA_ORIENTATION=-